MLLYYLFSSNVTFSFLSNKGNPLISYKNAVNIILFHSRNSNKDYRQYSGAFHLLVEMVHLIEARCLRHFHAEHFRQNN